MGEGEVDSRGTGRIVDDRDDGIESQRRNHSFKVTELLRETVLGPSKLVGLTEAQEVEGYDMRACSSEIWHQRIVNSEVIGKTMHKHEGRSGARVIAGVDAAMASWHPMLDKAWLGIDLAIASA